MAPAPQQLVMPFAVAPSYQPQDFIRGAANGKALELIERWPNWPYSLLVLHGSASSGKTHLAHYFAAHANAIFLDPARIGTVPAEQLMSGHHSWVIDGIDPLPNEAALAQLINLARARGDYVLMTARAAPARLKAGLADLRSRLASLPEVGLGLPDDALLEAVLTKAFADRQVRVAPEALAYAVARLERSFAAAHRFAEALDRDALASGSKVNLALMRRYFAGALSGK